jgi:hypothetical protein
MLLMFYASTWHCAIDSVRKLAFLKEIVPCIDIVMESELHAPWWEQLPDDFWQQADGTELDARNRLKVHGTAAIERVLRTSLSATVAAAMAAAMSKGGGMEREFDALRFYEPLARAGDASRVFLLPPKGIAIEARPVTGSSVGLRGIKRFQLSFASPFKPLNPAAQPQFDRVMRWRMPNTGVMVTARVRRWLCSTVSQQTPPL